MTEVLRHTRSLCPECLAIVPARLLTVGDEVVLEGTCEVHGAWRTLVWAGAPSFRSWCGDDPIPAARHTCTAVVEVTRACDLGCPVCFAESPRAGGTGPCDRVDTGEPTVAQLMERFGRLFSTEGEVNIQLSGGEPTTRDDLPDIISSARAAGFTFVQLNTNGLRLAEEEGYAEALRAAGLASVFLQFDGLSDRTYQALRGRPLRAEKLRAVARCAEAGLAVVLVPTVVPGLNAGELGELVRFSASWPGVVRGLHLQPISYFGRYPDRGRDRLVLPQILRLLEEQTGGQVRAEHFAPSCCEHVRCSFRARYWVREGANLEALRAASCCCTPEQAVPLTPQEVPRRAVAATARQWSRRERTEERGSAADSGTAHVRAAHGEAVAEGVAGAANAGAGRDHGGWAASPASDGLSRFLEEADRILSISGMLFQDAWSIDLERVDRCCVQVLTEPGAQAPDGLAPFCLWNLTSASGERLYPR